MNNILFNVRFKNLIKESLNLTKSKFLFFAKDVYGIQEDTYNSLWNTPVKSNTVALDFLMNFSESKYEEILKSIIEDELGDSEAAFIPKNNIIGNFASQLNISNQDAEKMLDKVPSFIIYNENIMKENFKQFINFGKNERPPKTPKETNNAFSINLSNIFLHEFLHANTEIATDNNEYIEYLNGVELTDSEQSEDILLATKYLHIFNEIFISTVADIISYYIPQKSIEDCMQEVLEKREGNSSFKDFDDRLVLSMFVLFSNEFCHWALTERFSKEHTNILKDKFLKLFDTKNPSNFEQKIGIYFNKRVKNSNFPKKLEKQKEMLEMLGIKNINFNNSLNKLIFRIKGDSQNYPSDSENKYSPSQRDRTTNMNIGE